MTSSDQMVYFTADLHLGHAKVADQRGFATVAEHDKTLRDAWTATVRPQDSVWVLGDLNMGNPQPALTELAKWPGTKHLIPGNHDACHPMHRISHKLQRLYLSVFESVELHTRFKSHGLEALLSHFPYLRDHTEPPRFAQWRLPYDRGPWLLHGHTHEPGKIQFGEVHVGVDAWEFTPVPVTQVLTLIKNYEHKQQVRKIPCPTSTPTGPTPD